MGRIPIVDGGLPFNSTSRYVNLCEGRGKEDNEVVFFSRIGWNVRLTVRRTHDAGRILLDQKIQRGVRTFRGMSAPSFPPPPFSLSLFLVFSVSPSLSLFYDYVAP